MSGTYSKEQQIHSLSSLSNAANDIKFDNFNQMQTYATTIVTKALADSTIQSYIGNDWNLIWGPVVFSNQPDAAQVVSDNAMLLLYSESQNLFVAAIAGTNLYSVYGWFQEDFHVQTTKKWDEIIGKLKNPLAAISTGSYIGLRQLLSMQSNGQTMMQALTAYLPNAKEGAEFATAGHSLGGALCPCLALYMYDLMDKWNTNKVVSKISAWPTAGPTPGNGAFASYAGHVLSYTSRYNTLDVIPHVWASSSISQIPTIYEGTPGINPPANSVPSETVTGVMAIGAVINTIDTSGSIPAPIAYQQIQPWNSIQGEFNKDYDEQIKGELELLGIVIPNGLSDYTQYFVDLARFLAQMGYQHIDAYDKLLDILNFMNEYQKVKKDNPPPNGQTIKQAHSNALYHALAKNTGVASLANIKK